MHLPYSLGRIAQQRIGKLVQRAQLRLKDQAADVDGDAFAEVVPMHQRLKAGPGAAEQHIGVRPGQQLIVLCIAQLQGRVRAAKGAVNAAEAAALVLADLGYGPAETDKEEENANDNEEEQ